MLKEFGEGYRYIGTANLGNRQCDVIEGDFANDRSVKAYIDCQTGLLIQREKSENGKIVDRLEILDLELNPVMFNKLFEKQLPAGVFVVKAPKPHNELLSLAHKSNITDLYRDHKNPIATWELDEIAKRGTEYNSDLKKLYVPDYIPNGYKYVAAGTYGTTSKEPDGTVHTYMLGSYNTAYIDYINSQTGDTISITESANELQESDGQEISVGSFNGKIITYKQPFAYVELFWIMDDNQFSVSASSLGVQEVIKIAKSLKPL